jgi:hypothetical protein
MQNSLAIVNALGQVVTFVRPDVPIGWAPPEGCSAVSRDDLPSGWQYAPEVNAVPASISARQSRLWLIRHGIDLAAVDAAIASIPDAFTRESVRIEWEYATEVHRDSQWLAALGPTLGLDAATLDAAFREAASL